MRRLLAILILLGLAIQLAPAPVRVVPGNARRVPTTAGASAPTLVRSYTNTIPSATSSVTISSTDATGANYALVAINYWTTASATATWNGVSMTLVTNTTFASASTIFHRLWAIPNPGSGNVVVTFTGATPSEGGIAAMLFSGVGSISQVISNSSGSGSVVGLTNTFTVASSDLVVSCLAWQREVTYTAPTNSTVVVNAHSSGTKASERTATIPGVSGALSVYWQSSSAVEMATVNVVLSP
jgi:hypothetical protein